VVVADVSSEGTDTEVPLRRMLDERAIEQVLVGYCRRLDDGRFEALLELFTDDAEVQFWGKQLRGKAALAEAYGGGADASVDRPTAAHVLSNIVVEVDGDTALATSDFIVVSRAVDGGYGILVCGRFVDDLVRSTEGAWRIRSRQTRALARPEERS
jgi:ketosteroid isomerase-like protein